MIETLPISQITFPNVTVCPPRDLFLNLNQDIKNSEKVKLTENIRNELLDFALDVIQDQYYKEMISNLSKLHFENWNTKGCNISIDKYCEKPTKNCKRKFQNIIIESYRNL